MARPLARLPDLPGGALCAKPNIRSNRHRHLVAKMDPGRCRRRVLRDRPELLVAELVALAQWSLAVSRAPDNFRRSADAPNLLCCDRRVCSCGGNLCLESPPASPGLGG